MRPVSTKMSPFSKRLTVPDTTSPIRLLYSAYTLSRSASRTFWKITCLAVWAAMRPSTSVGFGNSISMSTSASSPYSSWASSSEISVTGSATSPTMWRTANSSTCPVSGLNLVLRFSSDR